MRLASFIALALTVGMSSPVAAQNKAPAFRSDRGRMPGELAALSDVLKPRADEVQWKQIPWLVDLAEGIKLAREEKRPVFLFMCIDEPLDRC